VSLATKGNKMQQEQEWNEIQTEPKRRRQYPKGEKKDEPKKELRETKRRITLRIKINKK